MPSGKGRFYHPNGTPVFPEEINETVDFVEAVSEDDKVVELVGCDRIHAGAPAQANHPPRPSSGTGRTRNSTPKDSAA